MKYKMINLGTKQDLKNIGLGCSPSKRDTFIDCSDSIRIYLHGLTKI